MDTKESGDLTTEAAGRLSHRQRECLALVAQGYSSKEIARTLRLSPSTVDNHLHSAVNRLGATNRADAARKLRASEKADGDTESVKQLWLPPLGGLPNRADARRRYMHVIQVALLGIMALAAITITIAGIVGLFGHR